MEKTILTDTLLVAYLSLQGFSVHPVKASDKLIAFEIQGEGVTKAVEQFYQNPKVPILTFCQHHKAIRSAIFNLKGDAR